MELGLTSHCERIFPLASTKVSSVTTGVAPFRVPPVERTLIVSDSVAGLIRIARVSVECAVLSVPCTCAAPPTGRTGKAPAPEPLGPFTPPTPVTGVRGLLGVLTGCIDPDPAPPAAFGGGDTTPVEFDELLELPGFVRPAIGSGEPDGGEAGGWIEATVFGSEGTGVTGTGTVIGWDVTGVTGAGTVIDPDDTGGT